MPTPKIKQGDTVVCKQAEGTLEVGQKYLVQAVDGRRVSLNHVPGWHLAGLFAKAESNADAFRERKANWYRGQNGKSG